MFIEKQKQKNRQAGMQQGSQNLLKKNKIVGT
jgi:hypothetical protein